MFVVTNYDYAEDEVSDVYGPFTSRASAENRMREMATSEFEELKAKHDDAEMFDDEPGEIEIVFDQDNANGCLYQVIEVEK